MVSATRAEAAHVPADLPVIITGVGKVAAASAVSSALAVARATGTPYDLVVNIGSAGALHDHLEGLHEIGSVLNHDLSADVLRGFGYDPQEWLTVAPTDGVTDGVTDGLRLATGDMFVSDATTRVRLAAQADLVDMEGYAVAWACRQAAVPVRLIKHVSDKADEGALDWLALVDLSARALGEWLRISLPTP